MVLDYTVMFVIFLLVVTISMNRRNDGMYLYRRWTLRIESKDKMGNTRLREGKYSHIER